MPDFFDVVKKRQSIRKLKEKEVSDKILNQIIDAARLAPSAMNSQPWDFVIVKDKALRKRVRKVYDSAREALKLYKQDTAFVENGTVIAVCSHADAPRHVISTSLAVENMVLAAAALELGSVIMTTPLSRREDREEIRELLKIPEAYDLLALVVIGHSDEDPEKKPKRDLGEITHINEF